jgi:hypothetical protein
LDREVSVSTANITVSVYLIRYHPALGSIFSGNISIFRKYLIWAASDLSHFALRFAFTGVDVWDF